MDSATKDTATRILDAAERLFVEHGFEATSLRTITQQARSEPGCGQLSLWLERRCFRPCWCVAWRPESTMRGRAGRAGKSGAPITVEAVLMTFIRPCLALSKDPNRGGAMFVRLLSRTFVENHRLIRDTPPQQYSESSIATASVFRVLPGLKLEELAWRLHLAFGLMFNALCRQRRAENLRQDDIVSARDPDTVVRRMIPFAIAGLTNPATQS